MIREKATNKHSTTKNGFYLVVAISIGVIILSTIVGYVQNTFNIRYLELIIYALIIVTAYFIIKKYLTEYRYSFFDDELIIERLIGKRIDTLATIRTWDIAYFGNVLGATWDEETTVVKCDVNRNGAYAIVYNREGIEYVITLSPSKDFVSQVQTALDTKHYHAVDEEKIIK